MKTNVIINKKIKNYTLGNVIAWYKKYPYKHFQINIRQK